jgi:peptidyl-prolyl cis-trans isomerase SurA
MLLISLVWTLAFLLSSPCGLAQEGPQILDEIVAKINQEIVTLTDLNSALNERRLELRQETGDSDEAEKRFKAEAPHLLKSYIHTRLMLQKAKELGFDADIDVDVSAFMENMRQEMGIPSLDVLDQYLRQQGSSLQKFREKVKDNLMTRSLIQNFVYGKITLLTPEVEAYYQENIEKFTEPSKVELAEILFLTEGKDRAAVRARAEEVLVRMEAGESFEELAKEYSEGPTASKGGAIGSFNRGTMNAALEEAAFDLEIGSISGIVESDYGFQIIKILSRAEEAVKPLNDVRPQISEALYQKKAQPEMEQFIKELIRDSYIFIDPKYAEMYIVEGLI